MVRFNYASRERGISRFLIRFKYCAQKERLIGQHTGANGCPQNGLQPASFEKQYSSDVRDAQCSSGGEWYMCPDTTPPFLGCCQTNPCSQKGCPSGQLVGALLSENEADKDPYSPMASPTSTTVIASSTMTSLSVSMSISSVFVVSSQSPTSTPSALSSSSTSKTPLIGAVLGGIIGGILISAALVLFLIFCRKWHNHRKKSKAKENPFDGTQAECKSQTFKQLADFPPRSKRARR